MATEKAAAEPVKGFQLLKTPDQPTLAVLVMKTAAGEARYLVHGKALKDMSRCFAR